MKITLQQRDTGEDEVILRYRKMNGQLEYIIGCIENSDRTLEGVWEGERFRIRPAEVIYLESVDGATWIYTRERVYRTGMTLSRAEERYEAEGYFRCSKSMVLNIYRIQSLRSVAGNRIDALMDNGEHVLISRRYAGELRMLLRGGAE